MILAAQSSSPLLTTSLRHHSWSKVSSDGILLRGILFRIFFSSFFFFFFSVFLSFFGFLDDDFLLLLTSLGSLSPVSPLGSGLSVLIPFRSNILSSWKLAASLGNLLTLRWRFLFPFPCFCFLLRIFF